ncbi:DgyrCDS1936 [Dimorphilus gyrociliatus]|uniref:Phenylalanine--tRNA ligase alpha subunit n=1 Tax=Dimorphilus gyrociliatus TaxID=2664684 RepID=A0A7I8VBL5_9ANNE|nr:DgyrCDS1936 [Dimorphilus gyrociliatus]
MTDIQDQVLSILSSKDNIDSLTLASALNLSHTKIVGALKSIHAFGNIIEMSQRTEKSWELTEEGKKVAQHGSHEARVFNAIPSEGVRREELMKTDENAKIGFSKAMSCGWITLDKAKGLVLKKVDSIEDTTKNTCELVNQKQLSDIPDAVMNDLKKRKLVSQTSVTIFDVKKGSQFTLKLEKPETDLTADMLINDAWKTKNFKSYNFNALGIMPPSGHLHPLLKVRTEFRQIFLEMGFTEMPTNNWVESSFWNFDALFQPQQHPARDAHDTFFISDPAKSLKLPTDYLERVKTVHSKGGYGSQGYKYDWKIEEAQKNLLRTHTTAVSTRMLYKLAQQKEFKPAKYFSIDRVNESIDSTHLAEFHQVEGLIADRDLTLGNLMGVLKEFFSKLGIKKLRFKPAYNPYTEPSMEIFGYHDGHKKWVEIGNSGVFRPEMLLPMGLPKDVSVIAWGLSLERPTMIKYKIDKITKLFGPKVSLAAVYKNPICRLEKQ